MVTDHQVKPTTPLYNVVIKGYAQTGDVKSAFRLFNDVSETSMKLNWPCRNNEH